MALPVLSRSQRPSGVRLINTAFRAFVLSISWIVPGAVSITSFDSIITRLGANPVAIQIPIGLKINSKVSSI